MVMHDSSIGRTDPITLTQWILTQQQIKASLWTLQSYFYTLSFHSSTRSDHKFAVSVREIAQHAY